VAIIGIACVFPGASNLDAYWRNIISATDAITDVPPDRWDPAVFFDPDSTAPDKLYCKRGGYLRDEAQFNPLDYAIMPMVVDGGEAEQFLSLRVAQEALADAGYADRPFNRERTEIILGRGNYPSRGNVSIGMHSFVLEMVMQMIGTLTSAPTSPAPSSPISRRAALRTAWT
jgi:acyl transferase domain-containing protein